MKEQITMSNRDIDRLKVLNAVKEKQKTWKQAAEELMISKRQIGRMLQRIKREGNKGIIHKLIGRPSNHQIEGKIKEKAIKIIKRQYNDFGPTLAKEKLLEIHRINISTSVLRKEMIKADIWQTRKQKRQHRQWRQRRPCIGELIQIDGSEHDWFEGRGPRSALIIFIDDATSSILHAEFVSVENTFNLMKCTRKYLDKHGRPVAIYVDKDGIYRINRQASIEEQLKDKQPLTQYTRAMNELGIQVIFANSPQAKGRVERSFDTHQDRLVKELRLAGISDIKSANKFLLEKYIPKHNAKFAVIPARDFNAHRELLKSHNLDEILSVQIERTLANDFTVRFNNIYLQILKEQKVVLRPKDKVFIQLRIDGSIHIKFKNHYINYKKISGMPYLPYYKANPILAKGFKTGGKAYRPPKNHPWKRNCPVSGKEIAAMPLSEKNLFLDLAEN